ncbi:ABC transporter permease [Zavarzinia compransoris]|uniref:ABC transporter permease n=2 Tax=Zavarzinia compransoris TaxID=1264899 RepID=A0A317DU13_9PROT|nr:ABC transporter permease [Zavarzinia compransoris]
MLWWPVGQVLGLVVDGLGWVLGGIGSAIYDWIAADHPGLAGEIDLLSFGKGGWGDDLWAGLQLTLQLAAISLVFGLVIGFLGAGAKLAPSKWLNRIGNLYTVLIRGLPELLTLMLIYYGIQFGLQGLIELVALQDLCAATALPAKMALFGLEDGTRAFCGATTVNVSGFAAGTVALSLVFGAFATEVLRGAILAVPKGQLEAARAIGMSRALLIRRVLIPQVWRFALPGLGNLWLNLVKDTSLVSVIALDELMRKAGIAVGVTKQPFLFYGAACALYLAVTGVSMIVFARAERWASRGVRRPV